LQHAVVRAADRDRARPGFIRRRAARHERPRRRAGSQPLVIVRSSSWDPRGGISMNRWVKRVLIGLGVLVGVLLIALGALVGYGEVAFGRTYERDLYPIEADTSPEGIARGEYLVKHVVACSGCHAERIGGALT